MEREKYSGEERTIKFLQDNLATLRKISGWTMQELGDKIGVTKQTISNLEKHKNKMSKLQAIGVAHVFFNDKDFDLFCPKPVIEGSARRKFLHMVIDTLYHKELPEEEANEYQEKFGSAATLIENGGTLEKVAKQLNLSVNDLADVRDRTDVREDVRQFMNAYQRSPKMTGLPSEENPDFEEHIV